ncbi:MAG: FecR domain-containing protein [Sandaracinaceae bacterium]|nr:FecR domain-containing protein [Sandaracinaceae bacterium]
MNAAGDDDRLLACAAERLRADPPALDARGVAALVRHAIEAAEGDALVDALAGALAASSPPEVSAARLAAQALREATQAAHEPVEPGRTADVVPIRSPSRRTSRRLAWGWLAAAVALVAVGAGLWARRGTTPAPEGELVHHLAAGHVVRAAPDARLSLDERGDEVRVVLEVGLARFEVVSGSRFRVEAGDVRVEVTGTAFTVRREPSPEGDLVDVHVVEGAVRVTAGDVQRRLGPGDRFAHRSVGTREVDAGPAREPSPRVDTPDDVDPPSEAAEPMAPGRPTAGGPTRSAAPRVERDGRDDRALDARRPPLDEARAALAAGRYDEALAIAERVVGPDAWLVRGDALRGLGRPPEALGAYREAMQRATNASERAVAGLSGARLLAGPLARPAEARELLDESGALLAGSPVRRAAELLDARLGPR